jgi:hypothetical protein
MKFSVMDRVLWAAGFYSTLALAVVLLWRGRWRKFPIFTGWLVFLTARTIVLFLLYQHGSARWYAHIYWWSLWPDFAFQLGVVAEIARIVLRPTGTWIRDARVGFLTAGLAGAVGAALLVWWVAPPAKTWLAAFQIRSNLFTSLVICELFVVMSITANRLGLGWRNHVMALGQGLTAWSSITVLTSSVQTFLGGGHRGLDQIRAIAYIAASIWMGLRLWIAEPERQPLAPELHKYIVALHQRVEYDLRRIDARN